jgi:hypothetical protein
MGTPQTSRIFSIGGYGLALRLCISISFWMAAGYNYNTQRGLKCIFYKLKLES